MPPSPTLIVRIELQDFIPGYTPEGMGPFGVEVEHVAEQDFGYTGGFAPLDLLEEAENPHRQTRVVAWLTRILEAATDCEADASIMIHEALLREEKVLLQMPDGHTFVWPSVPWGTLAEYAEAETRSRMLERELAQPVTARKERLRV